MANENSKSHIGCKYYFGGRPDIEEIYEILEEHINRTDNPHHTTKKDIVGLENVDNTHDMDKPVSTAQKEYIDIVKADLADLENRFRAVQGSVVMNRAHIQTITEKTIPGLEAEFRAQLESAVDDLTTAITDLENKEAADFTKIDESLTELRELVDNVDLALQMEVNSRKEADIKLHNDMTSMKDDLDKTDVKLHNEIVSATEDLSVQITNILATVDSKISTLTKEVDEALSKIEALSQKVETELSQIDTKMEQYMAEFEAQAQEVITELNAEVAEAMAKLKADSEALLAEVQAKIQEMTAQIAETMQELDEKISAMEEYVDTTIAEALVEINGKLDEMEARYNQQFEDYKKVFDGQIDNVNVRIDAVKTDIESTIDAKVKVATDKANAAQHDADEALDEVDQLEVRVNATADKVTQEILDRANEDLKIKLDLTGAINNSKIRTFNITKNNSGDYTFVITLIDGTTVSATTNIPIDSVVEEGHYDPNTKNIVLTLSNGSKVYIPVADLVSGLASTDDLNAEKNARITAVNDEELAREAKDAELETAIQNVATQVLAAVNALTSRVATAETNIEVVDTRVTSLAEQVNTYFAKKSELAAVATSGSYNDLKDKPSIPTVDVNKEYVDAQRSIVEEKINAEKSARELADNQTASALQATLNTALGTKEDAFTGVLASLKQTLQAGNVGYIKVIDGGVGATSTIVKTIDLADKLSHVFIYDNDETLTIDLDALKNL